MIERFGKAVSLVIVCALLVLGVSRAMISKYQQKRQEILAGCKAERDKLGVAEQKALAGTCPTPEVALVSPATLNPGQTADVTVTGKFPAGTKFLFTSDCVEVLKESVVANTYRATIRISAECGPETAAVEAFVPVCCKSGRRDRALTIDGAFVWDLTASNGWRVRAVTSTPEPGAAQAPDFKYLLEFYRQNETAPFTRREATLYPSGGSSPPSYYFSVSNQDESSMSAQQQMERLTKQLNDPSLSDAAREKLMAQFQELIKNMAKDASKMADPAYMKQLQAQAEEFGCGTINLTVQNGSVTGTMRCSQKVGANLKITGSMKPQSK